VSVLGCCSYQRLEFLGDALLDLVVSLRTLGQGTRSGATAVGGLRDRQTDRQTDRLTDRLTDRQADRLTDRQTD
jgi:hypothetical protein